MNICDLFVSLVKRFDLEDTPLEPECKTDVEDRMDELVKKKDRKDEESTDATVELNNKRFVASFHSPTRLIFHAQSVSVQKELTNCLMM